MNTTTTQAHAADDSSVHEPVHTAAIHTTGVDAVARLAAPSPDVRSARERFEHEALEHAGELFATAMRYARDARDAEDLVQETWLRAFAAWERFEEGTNCRAWLFRILTNNFINECRRITKERRHGGAREVMISPRRREAANDPETAMLEHKLGDEVLHALARLPQEFRRVVELADLEGLSYREVAQQLRCPMGTVMSRLHRGRRMLSDNLGGYAREQGILRAA